MTFGATYPRTWALAALLAVVPALWSTDTRAGQHGVPVQTVVPVYVQAPAVSYVPAPVVSYVPAPVVS